MDSANAEDCAASMAQWYRLFQVWYWLTMVAYTIRGLNLKNASTQSSSYTWNCFFFTCLCAYPLWIRNCRNIMFKMLTAWKKDSSKCIVKGWTVATYTVLEAQIGRQFEKKGKSIKLADLFSDLFNSCIQGSKCFIHRYSHVTCWTNYLHSLIAKSY